MDKVISQILPFATSKHLWIEMSTTENDQLKKHASLIQEKNAINRF